MFQGKLVVLRDHGSGFKGFLLKLAMLFDALDSLYNKPSNLSVLRTNFIKQHNTFTFEVLWRYGQFFILRLFADYSDYSKIDYSAEYSDYSSSSRLHRVHIATSTSDSLMVNFRYFLAL